jgi:hypothetical protein
MKHIFIIFFLWLAYSPVLAEVPVWSDSELEAIKTKGTVTDFFDFENDSLLLTQKDGFYTSGMRYSRHYRLRTNQGWRSAGWRVGQQLYTTSDVRLEPQQIARLGHPYAGWLYGGFMMRSEADDGSETAIGLDIGCLGPCAGGAATPATPWQLRPACTSSRQQPRQPTLMRHMPWRTHPARPGQQLTAPPPTATGAAPAAAAATRRSRSWPSSCRAA